MISESEGMILLVLYGMDGGRAPAKMLKKAILILNGGDIDEEEEAITMLKGRGYIDFDGRAVCITDDGKRFLHRIAIFEPEERKEVEE